MTDNTKNEIAELKAELDKLKPTEIDDKAMRQWQSDMHNLRERRAASFNPFSRDQLEEMERAAPTHVVRAIVGRDSHAPAGPSSAGTSGQVGRVSANPGIPGSNTGGWAREIPLGPPPGIRWVDAQLDAQDLKDRRELIEQKAKEQALLKAAEKSE